MTVFLAWSSEEPEQLSGPWYDVRPIAPGLLLLESGESLSVVYHALKWALSEDAALIVSPVTQTPKSRGMAPGTTAWLRSRTVRAATTTRTR